MKARVTQAQPQYHFHRWTVAGLREQHAYNSQRLSGKLGQITATLRAVMLAEQELIESELGRRTQDEHPDR